MTITLLQGDCIEMMRRLDEASVDLVLCDLPYGTTACAWDSVIPMEDFWPAIWRVVKQNAPVVLTATQPFTTALIASQMDAFKYTWVWEKSRPAGFAQAKNMPLKAHEDICVFSRGVTVHASQSSRRMPYNPQGLIELEEPVTREKKSWSDSSFSKRPSHRAYQQTVTGYPRSVLKFPSEGATVHPTQKPVALMEYLIRTYSEPGDVVLDCTMGSGTTGVACAATGRSFIGVERDAKYYEVASSRLGLQLSAEEMLA